jgi:hypothetical protein
MRKKKRTVRRRNVEQVAVDVLTAARGEPAEFTPKGTPNPAGRVKRLRRATRAKGTKRPRRK